MVNGNVYAMDSICSLEGGPLEEGTLEGYNLTCPKCNGFRCNCLGYRAYLLSSKNRRDDRKYTNRFARTKEVVAEKH
jgi:hypothetical protein